MNKQAHAGVDVSAETLVAMREASDGSREAKEFPNTARGHKALIRWALKGHAAVRVVLESTGTYGFDVAWTLHGTKGCEVMVLGSKAARRFAESLGLKDKDDLVDAEVLLEYALRMPFAAWTAPALHHLQLHAVTRRIRQLLEDRTAQQNRLHAARATISAPTSVRASAKRVTDLLTREIEALYREAAKLVQQDEKLRGWKKLLVTVKGIAERSALLLIGELVMLQPGSTAREWVAYAGLYPRRWTSGKTVRGISTIGKSGNRYLKAALYMPALAAGRHDPPVRAFRDRLRGRGLKPIQATIAVMRKLLHAIHAMLATNTAYDAIKAFPPLPTQTSPRIAARRKKRAPSAA